MPEAISTSFSCNRRQPSVAVKQTFLSVFCACPASPVGPADRTGVECLPCEMRKTSKKLLPYVFLNREETDKTKRFDKVWKNACQDAEIGIRQY
jgi:hypothetical protein